MASKIKYMCSKCGREFKRDQLTVKRIIFQLLGSRGRALRSRNVEWLCPVCLDQDPVWRLDSRTESPGHQNAEGPKQGN